MRLITAREASEILGVRLPRLYELARLKVVPFVRIGPRQIRFDPDKLADWATTGGAIQNEGEAAQDFRCNATH